MRGGRFVSLGRLTSWQVGTVRSARHPTCRLRIESLSVRLAQQPQMDTANGGIFTDLLPFFHPCTSRFFRVHLWPVSSLPVCGLIPGAESTYNAREKLLILLGKLDQFWLSLGMG